MPKDSELNFSDVFDLSDKEKQELNDDNEKFNKNKESHEQLAKRIAFYLYDDLNNLKQGKDIHNNLEGVFEGSEKFLSTLGKIKNTDLFKIFKDYLEVRQQGDESGKLHLFFDVNNEDIEYIIMKLESISKELNVDIIKNIIERDELEKKFKELDKYMQGARLGVDVESGEPAPLKLEAVQLIYSNVSGELLDEDNIIYLKNKDKAGKDIPFKGKETTKRSVQNKLKNVRSSLKGLVDWEIESLDNKEFEYKNLTDEQREEYKKHLLEVKDMSEEDILDIKNMAFIGQVLENRINAYDVIKREYEKINQKIGKFFPNSF